MNQTKGCLQIEGRTDLGARLVVTAIIGPVLRYRVGRALMEKDRKVLCGFWASVFPVVFMFLNVMVVGVLGAAGVIAVLKVLFPVYDSK